MRFHLEIHQYMYASVWETEGGIPGDGSVNSGSYIDFEDTWVFDFETLSWTEKSVFPSPDSRLLSEMDYDSTNNMVLIFGRSSSLNSRLCFDDLWSLNTTTYQWDLIGKDFGVGKMGLPSLEYDASSNSVILSGGYVVDLSLRFYKDTRSCPSSIFPLTRLYSILAKSVYPLCYSLLVVALLLLLELLFIRKNNFH